MPTLRRLAARAEIGRAAVIPPGLPAGQRRRQHVDPRLRPAALPHRPGADRGRGHGPAPPARPGRLSLQPGHDRRRRRSWSTSPAATRPPRMRPRSSGPSTPSSAPVPALSSRSTPASSTATSWWPPPHGRPRSARRPTTSPTAPSPGRPGRPHRSCRPSWTPLARSCPASAARPTRSGCGVRGSSPRCPRSAIVHGVDAALCTAVDLVRGLGVLTGIEVVEVEGATGWLDTAYENKRDAALATLASGADLFLIHVEATDEASHAGDLDAKIARPRGMGLAASSPAWSTGSTPLARGACCCCPTTRRRCGSRPTPPTRSPTSSPIRGPIWAAVCTANRPRCGPRPCQVLN